MLGRVKEREQEYQQQLQVGGFARTLILTLTHSNGNRSKPWPTRTVRWCGCSPGSAQHRSCQPSLCRLVSVLPPAQEQAQSAQRTVAKQHSTIAKHDADIRWRYFSLGDQPHCFRALARRVDKVVADLRQENQRLHGGRRHERALEHTSKHAMPALSALALRNQYYKSRCQVRERQHVLSHHRARSLAGAGPRARTSTKAA